MIYIIYGKDDYTCRQELQKIKNNLGDQEMLAVNTTWLDGKQVSSVQLLDTCKVMPFLHPVRLVIVEGLLSKFESDPKQKRSNDRTNTKRDDILDEWRSMSQRIHEIPETTIVIFIDGNITTKNKLLPLLAPSSQVKTFPLVQGESLKKWILIRVKGEGGTISVDAMNVLIDFIGSDLWVMSTEIEKLLAFKSSAQITGEDVRLLTGYSREISIFALVDMIVEGKAREAHKLLHYLFTEGANASAVIGMITRQLRLIVIAKDFSNTMMTNQMMDKLGTSSRFVLEKTIKQAKLFSLDQLRSAYNKVLEADIAIKTSQYEENTAIDLLVIELCQKKSKI